MRVERIPLDKIRPSPFQIRSSMDPEALERLAESLSQDGQQRPVKARPLPDQYFELVFGHRTVDAAKIAGKQVVQAIVEDLTDEEVMWAQYAENEYREDISDYDRAKWLRSMIDKFDHSQGEIGEKAGLSRNRVNQLLRMFELKGVTAVTLSKMTERQTRTILQAPEEDRPALVNYVELYLEEKGEILPASAIEDFAKDLTSAREIEKNRHRFLYEIEGESTEEPVEVEDSVDEEAYMRDPRPLLKEPPTVSAQDIAFITERIGGPTEDLQAKLMEEHGLSEEEAQAALQAFRETFPDIWSVCYPETEEPEEPMTAEQYVADVLMHNTEVGHEELARVTAEMFDVAEEFAQELIDRTAGKRRGRKPRDPTRPTIPCPLCGRANAEKNRILMVLEAYETQPGVTVVEWLKEVLA